MISIQKWMILTPLQKMTKNGEDWGKLIVVKAFKKLPKLQYIAQSGHTAQSIKNLFYFCLFCDIVKRGFESAAQKYSKQMFAN